MAQQPIIDCCPRVVPSGVEIEVLSENAHTMQVMIWHSDTPRPCPDELQRITHGVTFDLNDRERLIEGFVNSVFVFDDEIRLTFNYKDGTITIRLADFESSDFKLLSPPMRGLLGDLRNSLQHFLYIRGNPHDHIINTPEKNP